MKCISAHKVRGLVGGLILLLWISPAAASAQHVIGTDRLTIEIDPEIGSMDLIVRGDDGDEVYRTTVPPVLLDGVPQDAYRAEGRGFAGARLQLDFEVVDDRTVSATWRPIDGQEHDFVFRFASDDWTQYYGTGERFNALNQRGYILPMITDDRYGNKGVGSYKPVPFVMSSRGFGLWLDSYAPSQFDLSGTERFMSSIRVRDRKLRVVFFGGPDMRDVLAAYTGQTGRSPVPPPWAFGLWKSRDVHHNQDSVIVDIDKLREHGIPASVLVLDSPWETGYNDFIVNREQFHDPETMFEQVIRRGFYTALWLTPFINSRNVIDMQGIQPASTNYHEAVERGVLVTDSACTVAEEDWWKGRGGLVDFTNPDAVEWWFDQLDRTQWTGVRAFKADDGEGNFVPDAVFHDGTDARLMKNRYAVLYDSVMQRYVDQRLDGDGVLIVRTAYTGAQKYPFAWAGDNHGDFSYYDGLPSVILAGQNAAMSGFSLWGSDIAGYAGTPSKEVFNRWTQFAAFTPFFQVHMTSNLGPWDFDAETLDIFGEFARLRTQLFPYLYEAVHETARSGMPVIRPMALAFPDDEVAAGHVFQYMFGPDLLVAPVYQSGTSRSVYLPGGDWVDFWDGMPRSGPAVLEVDAPLARMPLFVRAGAVLPMLPADIETLIERHDRMDGDVIALDDRRVVQVWPGATGSSRSSWDGISAELTTDGGRRVLVIESERLRPIDIELPFANVAGIDGARADRYDDARRTTVLTLDPFTGQRTISWSVSP
jgi:alpha-D-xyloside xylohydrolase